VNNKFGFDLAHAHRLTPGPLLPIITIYSFAVWLSEQVEVVTARA